MSFDKAKSIDLANRHLQKGAVDKALREYDRILQFDPRDIRIRQKLAELLARQKRNAEALREFQVVADGYEKSGFFPKAAAIYKQMLRVEPESIPLHMHLGEIYSQLGMRSDAADHFRKVAAHVEKKGSGAEVLDIHRKLSALNPQDIDARFKLAELYMRQADPIGAAQLFREMAQELERTGPPDDLLRVYERLTQIDTDDLDLFKKLASLHLARNDPRRALQRLQVCFKTDPQDTETLTLMAQAFGSSGETEKAIQVYEELLRQYEDAGESDLASQVEGRLYEMDPSRREASPASTTFPEEGLNLPSHLPEDAARMLTEAEVYLRYGLLDRARGILAEAASKNGDAFSVFKLKARLHVQVGEVAEAVEACQVMHRIALSMGEMEVARAALQAAVSIAPHHGEARARLRAFDEKPPAAMSAAKKGSTQNPPAQSAAATPAGLASLVEEFAGLDDLDGLQGMTLGMDLNLEADLGDEARVAGPASMDEEPDDEEIFDLARALESELGDEDGSLEEDLEDGEGEEEDLPDEDTFEFQEGEAPITPPSATMGAFELGKAYFDVGLYEEARAEFVRAFEEGLRVAESLEMVGICLRKQRQWDAAVAWFQKILQGGRLDPDSLLRVLFELGVTYEARGDKPNAYRVYHRLLTARPDYRQGEVRQRLEGLAVELGVG